MQYNPQIHHRRSIRLKGYDYSKAGLYFITICCKDREYLFGEIVGDEDGIMELNDAGKIADECWLKIPEHFPNVILHEHIVMPNHVHGIIELSQNNTTDIGTTNVGANVGANVGVQNFEPLRNGDIANVGAQNFEPPRNRDIANVGAENFVPQQQLQPPPRIITPKRNEFQKIIPRSVGSIIRGYKTGVTKWFRENTEIYKPWQRNFHEHIIRNEEAYERIANYIINNPKNWREDKFYKR